MTAQTQRQDLAPVVIVHGMWSTPEALTDLRHHFERKGHEVHTPALPFHKPLREMGMVEQSGLKKSGMGTYVAAIKDVIASLDRAPILIGHSMGALISQLVAQSTDLEKLVLISSAPPAGINAWSWSVVRTFGHNLFKFPMWKKLTELRLENIRYGIANTQSAEVQNEIFRLSTYESGLASFQLGMWFLFRKPATRLDTTAIQCPVLMLSGQDDRITTIGVQRKLAAMYEGRARLVEFPGVCHWTIGGHAFEKIVSTLDQWLEEHETAVSPAQAA